MAQFKKIFYQDLTKPRIIHHCEDVVFTGDNLSEKIGVYLYDNGEPYAGGGTVSGTVINSRGQTVPITTGEISGNIVTVTLEEAALAVPGIIGVYVKLTSGQQIATVLSAKFSAEPTETDQTIDPGTIISSVSQLITDIQTAVDSIPPEYTELLAAVAPTFSASTAYTAWSYVWQGGNLYRFTADHAAGLWTGTDAVQVSLAGDLGQQVSDLRSNLVLVQSTQPTAEENRIWIPTEQGEDVEVPTYEEFEDVKSALNNEEDNIRNVDSRILKAISGEDLDVILLPIFYNGLRRNQSIDDPPNTSDTNTICTQVFPVDSESDFDVKVKCSEGYKALIAIYNANGSYAAYGPSSYTNEFTYTVASTYKYIAIEVRKDSGGSFNAQEFSPNMISISVGNQTNILMKDIDSLGSDLKNLTDMASTFVSVPSNINLFNRNDPNNKAGSSISGSTGAEITNAGTASYTASYFIDITWCKKLSWRSFGKNLQYSGACFYKEDKTPISPVGFPTGTEYYQNLTVPAEAKYFRFSFLTAATNVVLLNSEIYPQNSQRNISYIGKIFSAKSNSPYLLEVSPYGDKQFKTIASAYARAYQIQSSITPVTILLYPGVYNEVLDCTTAGGQYVWGAYVSFVGVDKEHVIWRDDTGLYANSPLHTSNPGLIKNITFIATHDDNPSFESTYADHTEPSQQNYGSYGLHIDDPTNGSQFNSPHFRTVIEDCRIVSKQHAAIGIGLRANQDLIVRRCEFLMDIPSGLENAIDSKKGCYLFHKIMDQGGGEYYQHMVMDSNTIETNMNKALYTYNTGGGITVDAFNNMVWSDANGTDGVINGPTGMFSNKSYGNNLAPLNKSS